MEIYQFFYGLLKDFGFPAFVAVFVLVRLEPAIREQTKVVRDLKDVLLSLGGNGTLADFRDKVLERERAAILQRE